MGLKRVSWVRGYQGQCRALRPLGHQGYRLRNYKKDPPLCSGYMQAPWASFMSIVDGSPNPVPLCDLDQVLLKEVMAGNRGLTLSDLKN